MPDTPTTSVAQQPPHIGPFVVRSNERTIGPFVHHAAAVEWAQRNQDSLGFYVVVPLIQPWKAGE